jgi:hypothetical protein
MAPRPALRGIAGRTGIDYGTLKGAFHDIKEGAGLRPNDSTRIDREGNVYDAGTGEEIGNVIDESGAR